MELVQICVQKHHIQNIKNMILLQQTRFRVSSLHDFNPDLFLNDICNNIAVNLSFIAVNVFPLETGIGTFFNA